MHVVYNYVREATIMYFQYNVQGVAVFFFHVIRNDKV